MKIECDADKPTLKNNLNERLKLIDYYFYYSKLSPRSKFFFLDGNHIILQKHLLHLDGYNEFNGKDSTILYLKRLLEID